MPQCHRCERENLPRCEVRKTSLGYVCKDNGKGTRCAEIVRNRRRSQSRSAPLPPVMHTYEIEIEIPFPPVRVKA